MCYRASHSLVEGSVSIKNSLHLATNAGGVKTTALIDTGSEVDLVTTELVETLVRTKQAKRTPVTRPTFLGSIERPRAFRIYWTVKIKLTIKNTEYEDEFAEIPTQGEPGLILGMPWLESNCPEALEMLANIGSANPKTPMPPSKDPQAAFSAGGDFALCCALEAEDSRRKTLIDKFACCFRTKALIDEAIAYRKEEQDVLASCLSSTTDPGVRGLTGNKEGWLETIPGDFRGYADSVFSDEGAASLPQHRPGSDCEIRIREGEKLKTSKIYDMSQEQLTTLKHLLDAELRKGFIRPSRSESSAPVFFVRDPPSESRNQGQLRLVVDYRDLNTKVVLDDFPIPLTRTVMNDLAGADYLTTFDVRSGFSSIRMAPGSEAATAFKTFYGLYEYTVMPMGLATAPSVFQRFINSVLNPFLGVFCHAYLDDIVIFTKGSLEKHKEQCRMVLEALRKNDLHLKPHKCKWFRKECSFLGFTVVCGKGIRMSDDKIQGIRDLGLPRGVHDVRSFLGVVGFYDKFIPHYSDTAAPLNELLKKGVPWTWNEEHTRAFRKIINHIRNDVFLAAFDPEKPIRLHTDASDVAYGAMMEQQDANGNWRPFLFFHHKFKDGEKGWDGPDKELYAIVYAFEHYRHFLSQPKYPVQVFTDHRNLAKFMFSSNLLKSHDGRLGRWWESLSRSNFTIEYRPGVDNVVPDFLSRYGYENAVKLDPKILLPLERFSPKARIDIADWFKKAAHLPNIREILEKQFAKVSKCTLTAPLPAAKNQNDSVDPVPQPKLNRLTAKFLAGYQGTPLEECAPPPHLTRQGADRRGLGQ